MKDEVQSHLIGEGNLATRLKKARTDKGLTQTELAAEAGWGDNGKTKVSKIEAGKQVPSEPDLEAWAAATGLSDRLLEQLKSMLVEIDELRSTYRKRMTKGQEPVQDEYTKLAETAHRFRFFEVAVIPRYIQVREYARAVLEEFRPNAPKDDVEEATDKRQESVRLLHDTSKKFEFLINEPVLFSRRFPADIMRSQLVMLMSVIGMRNVRLGIYPSLSRPTRRLPLSAFELFDDFGFIETMLTDGPKLLADAVDKLSGDFAELWEDAVEGDEARAIILEAINRLPAE